MLAGRLRVDSSGSRRTVGKIKKKMTMPRIPVTLVDQGNAAASATTARSIFRSRALFARAASGPLHVVHASESSAPNQRIPFTSVVFERFIVETTSEAKVFKTIDRRDERPYLIRLRDQLSMGHPRLGGRSSPSNRRARGRHKAASGMQHKPSMYISLMRDRNAPSSLQAFPLAARISDREMVKLSRPNSVEDVGTASVHIRSLDQRARCAYYTAFQSPWRA